MSEAEFMAQAFELAEEALKDQEVPVGCVFVHNDIVIGSGRNQANRTRDPTTHAEMMALKEIEKSIPNCQKIMSETALYVTLEPCVMCAAAMYEIGIKKIVYGAENERFGGIRSIGNREKYRTNNEIKIVSLVDADRSINLLKKFYERENPYTPSEKRLKKHKTNSSC